jgi:hypothetical protein
VLEEVRVSVGRTWRFVTSEGRATVTKDVSGYKGQLDQLKNKRSDNGFGLPWPRYHSTLWGNLIGYGYQQTRTKLLVAALLPLLLEDVIEPQPLESQSREQFASLISGEAFLHPFAVTTVLHLRLERWPEEGRVSEVLDALFHHPLGSGQQGQVRHGAALSLLPVLPGQDFECNSASFELSGGFVLLSGLHHQDADPMTLAYRLASLYQKVATDKSQPMNTERTAVSVTGQHVGMLLPWSPTVLSRAECLHRNTSTLLAYIENLAAVVVPEQTTQSGGWFQSRAASILNHLYRRKPLPEINNIYKSRVAQMWIDHRDLSDAVNRVNEHAQSSLPELPVKT